MRKTVRIACTIVLMGFGFSFGLQNESNRPLFKLQATRKESLNSQYLCVVDLRGLFFHVNVLDTIFQVNLAHLLKTE